MIWGDKMNNEIWKPIKGYEGLYEVSNTGKVKSIERTFTGKDGVTKSVHERILVLSLSMITKKHPIARYTVELWKDNKRKRISIHRIVAITFLPNLEGKPQVNHIDGNPKNNNIENLEWATNSENVKHAYKTGLMKPKGKKPIKGTNLITGEIIYFDSVANASKYFNVTEGSIKAPLKGYGRSKNGCGYKWEYQ
jgi:hypothetical protein